MVTWQDAVNSMFEVLGGVFICLSIKKLHEDKIVRGVSWIHALFFFVWGFWNLYFYPWIGAWASFAGSIAIVVANAAWLLMLIYYTVNERNPLCRR